MRPEGDEFAPGRLLVAYAKVYCFAHQFDCELLRAFTLERMKSVLVQSEPSWSELLLGLSEAIVLIYCGTYISDSNTKAAPKSLEFDSVETSKFNEAVVEESTVGSAQLFGFGETTSDEPARTLLMAYLAQYLEHLKDADPMLLEKTDIVKDLMKATLDRATAAERAFKYVVKRHS